MASGSSRTDGAGDDAKELLLGDDGGEEIAAKDGMGNEDGPAEVPVCNLLLLNVGWAGLTALVLAWNIVLLPSQARATVGDEKAGRCAPIPPVLPQLFPTHVITKFPPLTRPLPRRTHSLAHTKHLARGPVAHTHSHTQNTWRAAPSPAH